MGATGTNDKRRFEISREPAGQLICQSAASRTQELARPLVSATPVSRRGGSVAIGEIGSAGAICEQDVEFACFARHSFIYSAQLDRGEKERRPLLCFAPLCSAQLCSGGADGKVGAIWRPREQICIPPTHTPKPRVESPLARDSQRTLTSSRATNLGPQLKAGGLLAAATAPPRWRGKSGRNGGLRIALVVVVAALANSKAALSLTSASRRTSEREPI